MHIYLFRNTNERYHFVSLSFQFWLAREIRKELKILNLKDRERWSTSEIVSWARKHLFMYQKTDISYLFGK